jgi:hypothetical protein
MRNDYGVACAACADVSDLANSESGLAAAGGCRREGCTRRRSNKGRACCRRPARTPPLRLASPPGRVLGHLPGIAKNIEAKRWSLANLASDVLGVTVPKPNHIRWAARPWLDGLGGAPLA